MKSISKDARGFVEGVVTHLKKSGKAREVAPHVQSLLFKMTATAKAEATAHVESAVKLTPSETQNIARVLSRIAGHEVSIVAAVNPALLGGLRITMGDWVVDTSIRNELNQMAHLVTAS